MIESHTITLTPRERTIVRLALLRRLDFLLHLTKTGGNAGLTVDDCAALYSETQALLLPGGKFATTFPDSSTPIESS